MSEANYEPEIGQLLCGQPYHQHEASDLLIAALSAIATRLNIAYYNVNGENLDPFSNSGERFECDGFAVEAYSWNEDEEQPWNFRWRDLRISWYKYLGRGTTTSRVVDPAEIGVLLDDCLEAVRRWERENDPNPIP